MDSWNTILIVMLIGGLVINGLYAFIIVQVLYYGWKEVEYNKSTSDDFHAH